VPHSTGSRRVSSLGHVHAEVLYNPARGIFSGTGYSRLEESSNCCEIYMSELEEMILIRPETRFGQLTDPVQGLSSDAAPLASILE
jgi:hypothetical protein